MESNGVQLTEPQRRVLDTFHRRADEGLPPPTYREVCRELGWRSTGTVRDHLRALENKGLISRSGRKWRGVYLRLPRPRGKILPLIGTVVAGRPIESQQNAEGEVFVPEELAPRGDAFVLRVTGDSMNGAGIFADDLVVVQKIRNPQVGDIVAATIDGETTLKQLQRKGNRWVLLAANPKYSPIVVESEGIIHGVVTAVMRTIKGSVSVPRIAHRTGKGVNHR